MSWKIVLILAMLSLIGFTFIVMGAARESDQRRALFSLGGTLFVALIAAIMVVTA